MASLRWLDDDTATSCEGIHGTATTIPAEFNGAAVFASLQSRLLSGHDDLARLNAKCQREFEINSERLHVLKLEPPISSADDGQPADEATRMGSPASRPEDDGVVAGGDGEPGADHHDHQPGRWQCRPEFRQHFESVLASLKDQMSIEPPVL